MELRPHPEPDTPTARLLHNPAYDTGYGTREVKWGENVLEIKEVNHFPFLITAYVHLKTGAKSSGFMEDLFRLKVQKEPLNSLLEKYSKEHSASYEIVCRVVEKRDEEEKLQAAIKASVEAGEDLPEEANSNRLTDQAKDYHLILFSQTVDQIADIASHSGIEFDPKTLCNP
jgi:hypothetical protein